jgi:hypothetical protein
LGIFHATIGLFSEVAISERDSSKNSNKVWLRGTNAGLTKLVQALKIEMISTIKERSVDKKMECGFTNALAP